MKEAKILKLFCNFSMHRKLKDKRPVESFEVNDYKFTARFEKSLKKKNVAC